MNQKSFKFVMMIIFLVMAGTILYFLTSTFHREHPESKNQENLSAGNEKQMQNQTNKPLRIGVSLGLTGVYSEPATMQEMAYRLWETEINSKGGLFGRKVEMVIVNDESNVEKAKEIYQSFTLDKRVDLVFGPYSSDITKAVAPIVDKYDYPMLSTGASDDEIWEQGYKNIFGISTTASRYSIGILNLALLYGLKKVAIIHADDQFSTQVAKGAKKWGFQYGLKIVIVEEFKKGTSNLIPFVQKAREAGAELILLGGHFNEAVDMRRALKQTSWYPKAFFATVGPALKKYRDTLGEDAEFSFSMSVWESHESPNFPGAKEFDTAFKKRYDQEPSYHAAEAFAGGQIIEAAIELAGGIDFNRDRIRQALYDLHTYSIIGRYAVDNIGVQIKRFPLTIQWQDGKKEIVWPEKFRTKEPIFK